MNDVREEKISSIRDRLADLLSELEELSSDEESFHDELSQKLDNLDDSPWTDESEWLSSEEMDTDWEEVSEKAEESEEAVSSMDDACEKISEAISSLEEIAV